MIKRILTVVLAAFALCAALPFSAFAADPMVNLAAGIKYSISYGEPISQTQSGNNADGVIYDVNEGQFTDSATASADGNDENWYRAISGKSRIVSFDLGSVCAVSEISANFLQSKSEGIFAPRYIKVYVSNNGRDYQQVGEHSNRKVLNSDEIQIINSEITLNKTYAVRYVKVEFSVETPVYCDEISVMGRKQLSGREQYPDVAVTGYLDSVGKYKDTVKLYNGYYPEDPYAGVLTESELIPYVAYVNSQGEIVDRMFDSVLLVPCDAQYPAGSWLDGKNGSVMSDWMLYIQETFSDGQNLDAIDKVAGKVYDQLGLDEKMGIFLTVPYPAISDQPFGDVNNDGTADGCSTLKERRSAVRWYVNECLNEFEAKGYENIELAGFYWFNSAVDYTYSDHEEELVAEFNDYVKGKGLHTLFSSGYLSSGFDHWQELGFSGAVMSTEFADADYDEGMLSEFAYSIFYNHLGAEIQTCSSCSFTAEDADYLAMGHEYELQLYEGSITGYMNSLTFYDQGIDPGAFHDWCYADTSNSKGAYLRRLYDVTYQYVNGTYCNMPPKLTEDTFTEQTDGRNEIVFELQIEDVDSPWEDIAAEVPVLPRNGEITLSSDKNTLIYVPNEGFAGNDSFAISVSDGFNRSENVVFTVKVNSANAQNNPSDSEDDDDLVRKDDSSAPLWLVIILSVALGAMLCGMMAMIPLVKKLKNML